MKHISEKKLSAYTDGELPENETNKIKDHLKLCSDCRKKAEQLFDVMDLLGSIEEKEVSPYFFSKIKYKISLNNPGNTTYSFFNRWAIFKNPKSVLIPSGVMLIVLLIVFTGNNLGKIFHTKEINQEQMISEEFNSLLNISSLDTNPEGSLIAKYSILIGGDNE